MGNNHLYSFISNENYEKSCHRCGKERNEYNSYGSICHECKDFMKKETKMILRNQPERSKRENTEK
jgi:hypothetical protein